MNNIGTYRLSNISFYCLAIVLSVLVIGFPPHNVFSYDVFGYYMYLPLKFKYHDLTIQNYQTIEEIIRTYHSSETFYQGVKWDNGNWVMRYPIGLSIFYAPFYFLADLIAPLTGYKTDGFSRPYQLTILYGCLLYSLIGLHFLKKILIRFLSDATAALTLLVIGLGTNYFFHSSIHGQGAMSHNIVFSLFALIVYFTILWHQDHQLKYVILLGVCTGLGALSRASEILIVLIPLLYGVTNFQTLKEKAKLFLSYKRQVLIFIIIILGIGFIQFAYWKFATGKFIVNPYGAGNPGEGFELGHPHVLNVLFSFRKGLFIYTPVMLFAIYGFYILYKTQRTLFWCLFIYIAANLYVVSSWSCWWYGSCFGNRALIPSYVALSIPLGFAIEHVLALRSRMIFILIVFLFIALNLFQSWQMYACILDPTNMSRSYYISTFLQTHPTTQEQRDLLLEGKFNSDHELFSKRDSLTHTLAYTREEDFEKENIGKRYLSDVIHHSGKNGLILCNKTIPSYSLQATFSDVTQKTYTWIKASVWVYSFYTIKDPQANFGIHMKHNGYIFKPSEHLLSSTAIKAKQWTKLEYFYLVPDDLRSKKDKICIFILNDSNDPIVIDDLKMESYEPTVDQSYF
jgi:hypothetical protein